MNIPTWKKITMSIIIAILITLLCCLSFRRPKLPEAATITPPVQSVKEIKMESIRQEETSSEEVWEVPEELLLVFIINNTFEQAAEPEASSSPEPAASSSPEPAATPAVIATTTAATTAPAESPEPSSTPKAASSSKTTSTSSSKTTSTSTSTSSSKTSSGLDRSKPLYKVYKGGYEVKVSTELQWYIRDLCEKYHFYEKYVYGMILTESTFKASTVTGNCIGLCQINKDWLKNENIKRVTKDYKSRDLKDPYDNLLTLVELWNYARNKYNLDLTTKTGMMKVLYWHNTGRNPSNITSSSFFNTCAKFANELVSLQ